MDAKQIRQLKPMLTRYLHIHWDSYPAGTTFAGTGLSPAGTTDLSRRTWTRTQDTNPESSLFASTR